jgi:hypothetical protein
MSNHPVLRCAEQYIETDRFPRLNAGCLRPHLCSDADDDDVEEEE